MTQARSGIRSMCPRAQASQRDECFDQHRLLKAGWDAPVMPPEFDAIQCLDACCLCTKLCLHPGYSFRHRLVNHFCYLIILFYRQCFHTVSMFKLRKRPIDVLLNVGLCLTSGPILQRRDEIVTISLTWPLMYHLSMSATERIVFFVPFSSKQKSSHFYFVQDSVA